MYCPNCKTQNPDDSVFCSNCGRRLIDDGASVSPVTDQQVRSRYTAYPRYADQRFEQYYATAAKGDNTKNWAAMTGLIMGICAVLLPILRELLCVPGLVISIMGIKSEKRAAAIVGVVASAIAIVVAVVMLIAFFHVYRHTGSTVAPWQVFTSI